MKCFLLFILTLLQNSLRQHSRSGVKKCLNSCFKKSFCFSPMPLIHHRCVFPSTVSRRQFWNSPEVKLVTSSGNWVQYGQVAHTRAVAEVVRPLPPSLADLGKLVRRSVYLSLCQHSWSRSSQPSQGNAFIFLFISGLEVIHHRTGGLHQLFQWERKKAEKLWKANTSWFNWNAGRKHIGTKQISCWKKERREIISSSWCIWWLTFMATDGDSLRVGVSGLSNTCLCDIQFAWGFFQRRAHAGTVSWQSKIKMQKEFISKHALHDAKIPQVLQSAGQVLGGERRMNRCHWSSNTKEAAKRVDWNGWHTGFSPLLKN